jgi:hypothetical protein
MGRVWEGDIDTDGRGAVWHRVGERVEGVRRLRRRWRLRRLRPNALAEGREEELIPSVERDGRRAVARLNEMDGEGRVAQAQRVGGGGAAQRGLAVARSSELARTQRRERRWRQQRGVRRIVPPFDCAAATEGWSLPFTVHVV